MKKLLENLIQKSLDNLYANDKYLIEHKVAERDITHRFAYYFENNMQNTDVSSYNVDCEYNRDGYGIKQVHGNYVYPDFILHKRGSNEDNLLIIEFKTWWNPNNDKDIEKIQWMMHPQLRYKYKYGCSITINQDNSEIFWVDLEQFQ